MSTPVETIADALIAFILSLLRDPAAVEEFEKAPQTAMASKGLQDACAADVRAVAPVVVDHPAVVPRPAPSGPNPPDPANEVIREITRIVNQFTIDNRSTIVDQSVNQNIWTEGGDVTQLFDQEAVVASGDEAVAAGDDATIVDSEVDVTIGDVAVGNTDIDGSFNDTGEDADADAEPIVAATPDEPADADTSAAAAAAGDAVATAVDAAVDAAEPAAAAPAPEPAPAVQQPADILASDMTAADTGYDSEASTALPVDEPVEAPIEEP